jgi:hypothetical protein
MKKFILFSLLAGFSTQLSAQDVKLPRVKILATGGTIAGAGNAADRAGYKAGHYWHVNIQYYQAGQIRFTGTVKVLQGLFSIRGMGYGIGRVHLKNCISNQFPVIGVVVYAQNNSGHGLICD